jgi:anti-anti-sigma factor
MTMQTLLAQVRQAAGAPGVAIVDLHGDITRVAEEALNAAYQQADRLNPRAIALNFGGVEFVNSTGIALIVGLLAQARKSGRRLLTFGLSEHYIEIFKITRLVDFMSVYADEAGALAGAQNWDSHI